MITSTSDPTANWKTYTDPLSHYSINYPSELDSVHASTNLNNKPNDVYIGKKYNSEGDSKDYLMLSDWDHGNLVQLGLNSNYSCRINQCKYEDTMTNSGIKLRKYTFYDNVNIGDLYAFISKDIFLEIDILSAIDKDTRDQIIKSFIINDTAPSSILQKKL